MKSGFWRLLGAYLTDLTIILCLNSVWLYAWIWLMGIFRGFPDWLNFFALLGWIILDVVYFAALDGEEGTFGKRILKLKEEPTVPFWKAFVAYGIDCALFVLIGSCIYFYMKHNLISHLSADDLNRGKIGMEISLKLLGNLFLISTDALLSFPFYFSILESLFGKSLGKKLMGLQVVQATPATKENNKYDR